MSFSFFTQAGSPDVFQKMSKAILNGKLELLSTYLTAGLMDVHAADNNGNTLLHKAVMVEDPLAVRQLLEYKVDPKKKNNFGVTPLSLSEELENTQITNMLTLGAEQNCDSKNNCSQKKRNLPSIEDIHQERELEEALWEAVSRGTARKVSELLSIGADKYINKIIKRGMLDTPQTLLLQAIRRLNALNPPKSEMAIMLTNIITIATSPLLTSENPEKNKSKAIQEMKEAIKIIDILIQHADVNLQADEGNYLTRPINLATFKKLPNIVEKLIQAGAHVSPDDKDFFSNPLYTAINSESFEIIEILFKYNAPFPEDLHDFLKRHHPRYHRVLLFVYQQVGNPDNIQTSSEEQKRPNNTQDKNNSIHKCHRFFRFLRN